MVWSSDVEQHTLVVIKPAHNQLPAFVFTAYTWELHIYIYGLRNRVVGRYMGINTEKWAA